MIDSSRRLAVFLATLLPFAATEAQELPDVGDLEARGVAIGRVNLNIQNVFDTSNPAEDKVLYRWANRVHLTTRPRVIEHILLFEPGDLLTEQVIDESARLLRGQRFVAEAAVTASRFDPATNTVDVDVDVRDAWTLEPRLKLARSGGENRYGFGFLEDNLFGLGKSLSMTYSSDVDRDERLFSYSDRNLGGSRKQIGAAFADRSDGREFSFRAGRPFFALDTRWSVQAETLDDQRVDPIYELGEVVDEFRHDARIVTVSGGRSPGLVDGVTRRWLAGLTLEEDEFQPSPGFGPPHLLPDNRRLIYPWAGVRWIGDDFRKVTDLNSIGRTEDIALGLNVFARVGLASPALDSDRRAILVDLSASRGWEPGGPGRLLFFESSATTRQEKEGSRNTVVALSGRYLRRNFGDEIFLASLTTVVGRNLDAENQILLGGDNLLRGYPLRYQSGQGSVVLNIEQRFYTDWYPFQLIRVGYAFFFDAGRVWGADPRNTTRLGTLYDAGVGLRLTSPKSSSGSVLHIDLAFPIDAPADIDNVQLIVEKKSSF